jgi:hypothetical protein
MEDPLKKELKLLEEEIAAFTSELHEVGLEMLKEGYTKYPIFIAHDGNVELGETLFDAGDYNVPYFINVSMLEDFIEAGIIPEDKTELFHIAYGDPKQFMCVFFVTGDNARFVFYPYAKRKSDN